MMAKNMPFDQALWKIPYRFFLDAVSAVKSLLSGEGRYFTSVFWAHVAFLRWLLLAEKRKARNKRSKGLKGYYHRSVVWAHFALGMKKFSEIVEGKN
jgi:hypothetical protein